VLPAMNIGARANIIRFYGHCKWKKWSKSVDNFLKINRNCGIWNVWCLWRFIKNMK